MHTETRLDRWLLIFCVSYSQNLAVRIFPFRTPFRRTVTNGGLHSASEMSRNGQEAQIERGCVAMRAAASKAQTMLCHGVRSCGRAPLEAVFDSCGPSGGHSGILPALPILGC